MAQITITIPDNQRDRALDALAAHWGYEESRLDENETKGQLVKRRLLETLERLVKAQEAEDASQQALDSFDEPGVE